jgi:hypothetical protein
MITQQHEIDSLVEELIENEIFDFFQTNFYTRKTAAYAFEVLKQKLEEMDSEVFEELFD